VSKLKLLVAPADTANNSERWYEFVVYLSRTLEQTIGLDTAFDMADFHGRMHQADIVFAPPAEAVLLSRKAGFIPTCRPANLAEEVVFVAHAENTNATLKTYQGANILAAKGTVPTRLGLTLLAKKGIKPGGVAPKNSWMHVVKALQSDTDAHAFLSKSFYEELNPLSKGNLKVLGSSKLDRFYLQMMVKPHHKGFAGTLSDTLLGMAGCDKGQQVLEKLGVSNWVSSSSNEVDGMGSFLRIS